MKITSHTKYVYRRRTTNMPLNLKISYDIAGQMVLSKEIIFVHLLAMILSNKINQQTVPDEACVSYSALMFNVFRPISILNGVLKLGKI